MQKVMRIVGALLLCLLLVAPVYADVGIDGNKNHHNQIIGGDYNAEGSGGETDVDVNVGNGLLNFSPSSKAYGGDAEASASVGDISNKNTNTLIGGGNATSVFGPANSGNIQGQQQMIEEGAVQNENKNTNFNTNINKNDNENNNSNRNTNLNTNLNSAKQGQQQQQKQGQFQTQGNKQVTKIKFEDAENKRMLPSGSVAIAGGHRGPDFREKASPTYNEGTVEELMEIRKDFTLAQLVVLSGISGDIDCDNRAYNSYREELEHPKKGTKKMNQKLSISITTERPVGTTDVGLFVCRGDSETDGAGVIAHAMIEALRHGSTVFYSTKNDFKKMLEASGWGIGLGGSGSTIINDGGTNASGAVITPSLGYGASESGYGKEPFVRGFGFRM